MTFFAGCVVRMEEAWLTTEVKNVWTETDAAIDDDILNNDEETSWKNGFKIQHLAKLDSEPMTMFSIELSLFVSSPVPVESLAKAGQRVIAARS